MRTLGNEIYLQRGEIWSLDFEVTNGKGDPFMLFKEWKNPYLVITVSAARYEQKGDFRKSWWLDLNNRWVEQEGGTFDIVPMKRFIETNALYIENHDIAEILETYTKITANGDLTLPFDITNYLFFDDNNADNKRTYKYVKDYVVEEGNIVSEEWEEYNFRIIKQFNTKDWVEQNYLFDIKILAGDSVEERVYNILIDEGVVDIPSLPWNDEILQQHIKLINNKEKRDEMQELFDDGWPLLPSFDIKSILLNPTRLTISANIMGGIK